MSELYNIDVLPDESFKIIDRYQQKYPFLTEKLNSTEYQKGSFCGVVNTI